jgi:hypothetical protein
VIVVLVPVVLSGCHHKPIRPWGYVEVRPTEINQASFEIPEDALLDVGIAISGTEALREKQLEALGTNDDIRQAECHFVPFHFKNTLESSGHWGAVQVVPTEDEFVDLQFRTKLVRSNGEVLQVEVDASDASGRMWLSKKYHAESLEKHFDGTVKGQREAYQDLYNMVANDLAEFKSNLSPEQLAEIQTVSRLKFARDFAHDVYHEYLHESGDGDVEILRLPSDDDPFMARIDMIRGRERMLLDTMNLYYEGFYDDMWDAYGNWRRLNRSEQIARRAVERDAALRAAAGASLIAGGVLIQAGDVDGLGAVTGILVLSGGQIVIDGINVSQQAEIHAAALRELGESFGSEMQPTVVELEGKQYELTGTAQEQYARWRDLLRRIYYEESGFGPPDEIVEQTASQTMVSISDG